MKSLFTRRRLAATALATAIGALSVTAIAQNTPAPNAPATAETRAGHRHDPQHHAERMQRMQQRMVEHQERLKASLQLTPQQEPAWNAFIARMQPAQRAAQPRLDRDAWKQLSTPERLDRMEAMKAERDRAMTQRHEAIRSFYAQLNPAQQKAFDAQHGIGVMRAGMKAHGMRHGHGGRHHRM
jgi:periplasmic protein CpxP/Spy